MKTSIMDSSSIGTLLGFAALSDPDMYMDYGQGSNAKRKKELPPSVVKAKKKSRKKNKSARKSRRKNRK